MRSMARTHSLQVVLRSGEDGWIVAECPALPGCISQGRTREEAIANIREALELSIESGARPDDWSVEIATVEIDAA